MHNFSAYCITLYTTLYQINRIKTGHRTDISFQCRKTHIKNCAAQTKPPENERLFFKNAKLYFKAKDHISEIDPSLFYHLNKIALTSQPHINTVTINFGCYQPAFACMFQHLGCRETVKNRLNAYSLV